MPETIAIRAPRRPSRPKEECVIRIRAELVSLGGAVMLAICLLVTALLIMTLYSPAATGMQRIIAIVLALTSWVYLARSASEELSLTGETITYRAFAARTRDISMADVETMLLIHQGLNLERGIETIEFRLRGKRAEHIGLGPCWQRHKLEAFLGSVEEALRHPKMLESVR